MSQRFLLILFSAIAALTELVSTPAALAVYIPLPDAGVQKELATCGQNVATRVLQYYGVKVSLGEMIARCPRSVNLPFFVAGPTPLELAECMNHWDDRVQFEVRVVSSLTDLKAELLAMHPVIVLLQPRKLEFASSWAAARFFSRALGYGGLAKVLNDSTLANYGLNFTDSEIPSKVEVPAFHYIVLNGWQPMLAVQSAMPMQRARDRFVYLETLNNKEYRISDELLSKRWFWEQDDVFFKKILSALEVQGGMMIVVKPKAAGPVVDWPFRRLFPKL